MRRQTPGAGRTVTSAASCLSFCRARAYHVRCSYPAWHRLWDGLGEYSSFCYWSVPLCLLLFHIKVGAPKSRQQVVIRGKDRAWVVFALWEVGPFSCGLFFFLPCLIHSYIFIALELACLKDESHILKLGKGRSTCRGSAIDIIKMRGWQQLSAAVC